MSYPKTLSPTTKRLLTPVLPKLEGLKEGQDLTIEGSALWCRRLREALYAHWRIGGEKELWTVKVITPTKLIVAKVSTPEFKITSSAEGSILAGERLEKLFEDHLLLLETEEEVQEKLSELIVEGTIDGADMLRLQEQWVLTNG